MTDFDVVIVGGGMVGVTAAVQFAEQGHQVMVLEKHLPKSEWLNDIPLRVSALNRFSEDYLSKLGIWSFIEQASKCQFKQLATWEQRQHAVVFDCADVGESHLGHIIRNEAIQIAGYQRAKLLSKNITFSDALTVAQISQNSEQATLFVVDGHGTQSEVTAKLVIAADGAMSHTRQLAGIGLSGWDYQQHCLSITIKTDFPTQSITWQEFQPSGPKAFLPLSEGYACLIWYDAPKRLNDVLQLSDEALKHAILDEYPELYGDFTVVAKAKFPLTRRQANQYVENRVVLVGDAAHTINPLAGQGVNLGFKDVHKLGSLLSNVDLADYSTLSSALKSYQRVRKADALVMSSTMDAFYLAFSNENTLLHKIRNVGLQLVNKANVVKKQVLKKAMGY